MKWVKQNLNKISLIISSVLLVEGVVLLVGGNSLGSVLVFFATVFLIKLLANWLFVENKSETREEEQDARSRQ